MEPLICEFCQHNTAARRVTKNHWLNGRLYIVENVEAQVCPECHERYYHATTLDAIDAFLSQEHTVQATLQVEVVRMQAKSKQAG